VKDDGALKRLIEGFRNHGLVVFLGAGKSMLPTSCLPKWDRFNEFALEALTRRVVHYTGREVYGDEAFSIFKYRRDATQFFAPDYQAQIITEECGEDYFRVLQVLDT
jgi:hypothetical protein